MENELAKKKALLLWQEGQKHQEIGEVSEAIRLYTESIALYPTAESHTLRGWAYSFQGKINEAIRECKKAIAIDPLFGNPYNDIGSYLISQGKITEAEDWLKKAKGAPRSDLKYCPYLNLSRLYANQGLLIQAIKELEQALLLAPNEPQCLHLKANLEKILH